MKPDPAEGPPPTSLRRLAADLTAALHFGVMGFLVVGWALPWPTAWWIYVVGAPIVILGWRVFADACWLSLLEAKLRGESNVVVDPGSGEERSRSFVAETLSRATGRPVSRRFAARLSYGVVSGGFVAAGIRLLTD